jgi:hypothetical protein
VLLELDVLLELELELVLAASAGAAAEAAATSDNAPPTSRRRARLLKRSFMCTHLPWCVLAAELSHPCETSGFAPPARAGFAFISCFVRC